MSANEPANPFPAPAELDAVDARPAVLAPEVLPAPRLLPEAFLVEVGRWGLRAVALFAPISIAVAEIGFGVALGAWALRWAIYRRPGWPRTPADLPFLAFLACGVLSAIAGIDAKTALWSLRSYHLVLLFYLTLATVTDPDERRRLVWLVTTGLFLAAWHRVYDYRWQNFLHKKGPGLMTRASQLAVGVPLLHALFLAKGSARRRAALGGVLAMQIAGLVCTFKRGAWLATLVALSSQLWLKNRKLVLVPFVVASLLVVGYPPVRVRLAQSVEDFMQSDNRLHMWEIGGQLIRDYPLGIGTHNGTIMQRVDLWGPNPPKHRHFHSDLITILVEDGYLGLVAFAAWLVALARMLLARVREAKSEGDFEAAVALGVATAFLSWNVNGLVEFNFGDAEVMLVLYVLLGVALGPLLARRPALAPVAAPGASP